VIGGGTVTPATEYTESAKHHGVRLIDVPNEIVLFFLRGIPFGSVVFRG
jgi:hypothetical protein